MKHHFLDQYSDRDSLLHRLDPRAKFIATAMFVLVAVLMPVGSWISFGLLLAAVGIAVAISRVSPVFLFKRSLVVLPFVLLVMVSVPFLHGGKIAFGFNIGSWHLDLTASGLELLATVMIKAWLSVLALSTLAATTRMSDLLKGMEKMKLPRILVMLMSFMYRYLFVLTDESQRLLMARNSRNVGGSIGQHIRSVGFMAGTLFLRSFERGERIYAAMLARGYDGHTRTLNTLRFRTADFVMVALAVLAMISSIVLSNLVEI